MQTLCFVTSTLIPIFCRYERLFKLQQKNEMRKTKRARLVSLVRWIKNTDKKNAGMPTCFLAKKIPAFQAPWGCLSCCPQVARGADLQNRSCRTLRYRRICTFKKIEIFLHFYSSVLQTSNVSNVSKYFHFSSRIYDMKFRILNEIFQ